MTKCKDDAPKTIYFNEIDSYNFDKTSYMITEEYVNFYFDFAETQSMNEIDEVLDWIDSLMEIFGSFT